MLLKFIKLIMSHKLDNKYCSEGQSNAPKWLYKLAYLIWMKRLSKYTKQEQTEIKHAVLLLRFRCTNPTAFSHKYVAYSAISKSLNIAYNTV